MQAMTHVRLMTITYRRVIGGPLHILAGYYPGGTYHPDANTACGLRLPGFSILRSRGYVDRRYGPNRCGDCFA